MRLEPEALEAFWMPETFVPANLRPGLQRYIEDGIPTGSFLEYVLCNDLKMACLKADPVTGQYLVSIVKWLWNYAPMDCHGSEYNVRGWMDARQRDAMRIKDGEAEDDRDRMREGPRRIRGQRIERTHEEKESSMDKYV